MKTNVEDPTQRGRPNLRRSDAVNAHLMKKVFIWQWLAIDEYEGMSSNLEEKTQLMHSDLLQVEEEV